MAELKMKINLVWVETEPTGENCECCGDMIFLKAIAPAAQIGSRDPKICHELRFCQSCADCVLPSNDMMSLAGDGE